MSTKDRLPRVLSSQTDVQTSVEGEDILSEFMNANGLKTTTSITFTAKTSIDLVINGDPVHMGAGASFIWGNDRPCRSLVTVNDGEEFYFWAEF